MCLVPTCAKCVSVTTGIRSHANRFCAALRRSANPFKSETIAVTSFVWIALWATITVTKHLILAYDWWLLALRVCLALINERKNFTYVTTKTDFPFSHLDTFVVVLHSKSISTTKNPDESQSPGER